jgi:very-short-patch-repair endonuclease
MDKGMFQGAGIHVFENARNNRKNPTTAELLLWEAYLRHKPGGFKFRRQHPLGLFIADFYSHKLKLVIEIDGSVHNSEQARRDDAERQGWIESQGIRVIRFRNEQIMHSLELIITAIEKHFPISQ